MLTPLDQFIEHCMDSGSNLQDILWDIRVAMSREAVKRCNGNQSQAADLLKTHRNNLVRWYGVIPVGKREVTSRRGGNRPKR